MHESLAGVEAGAFQPGHFARHARSVIVQDRGLNAAQRPSAALVRRRVTEVDENLTAPLGDSIGANRVAANQRLATREVEFPIMPIARQHASRPEGAFAQGITFVRTTIGNRKEAILMRDHEYLLALVPDQLAAMGAEFAALQPRRGEHRLLSLRPFHLVRLGGSGNYAKGE